MENTYYDNYNRKKNISTKIDNNMENLKVN